MDTIAQKYCSKCGEVKNVDQFWQDKTSKDGYYAWCKQCKRSREAERILFQKNDLFPRQCKKCGEVKSVDHFHRNKGGYIWKCKDCSNAHRREVRSLRKDLDPKLLSADVSSKQCSRCNSFLPSDNFFPTSYEKDGLSSWCRQCHLKYNREHPNPLYQRNYWFRRGYGITIDQYNTMFEQQGGVCASCHMPESHHTRKGVISPLAVDHDHKTGLIRALLCSKCNMALGSLKEDPDIIRALADYAEWCKTL